MRNQVTNGFDRMTVSNLVMKANFIVSEMTTRVDYFPAPVPALADVQASIAELQTANIAAENRDRVAISYRNEKKEELVILLRRLGTYVNFMADSNRTIALSSGFDVAREPQTAAPIDYIEVPVVSLGANAGELVSRVKAVAGAKSYQYMISADDQLPLTQWSTEASTKTSFNFKGLQSAQRYYIRVGVVGTNSQWLYSDSSTFVTQ